MAPPPFACAQRPPTQQSPSPDIPISSPSPSTSSHSITTIIAHHIPHGNPPHDRRHLPSLPPLSISDARMNVPALVAFVGCMPAPPRGAAWAPAHLRQSLPYSVRPCGWRTSAIPSNLEPAWHKSLSPHCICMLTCCRRLPNFGRITIGLYVGCGHPRCGFRYVEIHEISRTWGSLGFSGMIWAPVCEQES